MAKMKFGTCDIEAAKAVARCGRGVTIGEAISVAGPILDDPADQESRAAAIWAGCYGYLMANGMVTSREEAEMLVSLNGLGERLLEAATIMGHVLEDHESMLSACRAVAGRLNSKECPRLPWIWAGANAMDRRLQGKD